MKIAMFSPLPPKETGIALYTENILHALIDKVNITLFDTHLTSNNFLGRKVYNYAVDKSPIATLNQYDLIVYHIGNNAPFHLPIYQTLCQYPGVVVLHDAVIYYLIAAQDNYEVIRDFSINYGFSRVRELDEIRTQCHNDNLVTYPYPERYPLLKTVLNNAQAIIVHSETTKNLVIAQGYKNKIYVIPLLIYRDALRCQSNLQRHGKYRKKFNLNNELIIGSFGFIGPTKRLDTVLTVLEIIKSCLNFKFLIVGTGLTQELQAKINHYHLHEHVIFTGYQSSNEDFFDLMDLCDIVINLRYPSMGETSSIVIQAMFLGKSCVVTNYGWFAELPDAAVAKISYDASETEVLFSTLTMLGNNKLNRQIMGDNARNYVLENCHPDQVANKYLAVFSDNTKTSASD
ncbi:MAG: glycosyltransferase [Gammaproteobacteria bacterium]|nr:glycosyltransferase [Gammaproteobacteria bacterium]